MPKSHFGKLHPSTAHSSRAQMPQGSFLRAPTALTVPPAPDWFWKAAAFLWPPNSPINSGVCMIYIRCRQGPGSVPTAPSHGWGMGMGRAVGPPCAPKTWLGPGHLPTTILWWIPAYLAISGEGWPACNQHQSQRIPKLSCHGKCTCLNPPWKMPRWTLLKSSFQLCIKQTGNEFVR